MKDSTISDSTVKTTGDMSSKVVVEEKERPYKGPTRRDMKKIVLDYDLKAYLDPKKLFRWPIEVWVSCGEAFAPPDLVYKNEVQRLVNRETVDRAEHELEKQSHLLRQMQGRRIVGKSFGKYKSIKNPDYPVVKEGHWTEVTFEEKVKQVEVDQLKNYVSDIRSSSKNTFSINKLKAAETSNNNKSNNDLFGKHQINVSSSSFFID